MNLAEALIWAAAELHQHGIEDPRLETEILLAHSLGLSKTEIITQSQRSLASRELEQVKKNIARRNKREPTAYITGFQPFLGLDFLVDRSVLIPRPETELLVETVINFIRKPAPVNRGGFHYTIADVGTGSGCIAVSLAKKLPNASVIGIDSSPKAIEVAKKNAEKHKVSDRCQFIAGNMFESLNNVGPTFMVGRNERTGTSPVPTFDIIVSNPPYIPSAEIDKLQPEVRDWEPRQALDGGLDGLAYIRTLIEKSPEHLQPGGTLLFEFGFGQADKIKEIAPNKFIRTEIIIDYSGQERIFIGVTGQ